MQLHLATFLVAGLPYVTTQLLIELHYKYFVIACSSPTSSVKWMSHRMRRVICTHLSFSDRFLSGTCLTVSLGIILLDFMKLRKSTSIKDLRFAAVENVSFLVQWKIM